MPDLPGQIQRYMVYVPEAEAPADGYASLVWTNGYALRPGDDVAGERDLYQQFAEREGNPSTNHEAGSKITPLLPSRRNQPVMEWAGVTDDFIPYNITRERADAYAAGDYDYEFISWIGLAAEHLVMCENGMWDIATEWMGDESRAVDPYVRNPQMDDPESGLVGDRAYWLSDIQSRDGELAQIDVVFRGLGVTDAPVPPRRTELGVADGTFSPVNPYLREARALDEPVEAPVENVLEITGVDVGTVTIDPERAGVGTGPGLESYDPIDPLEPLGNPAGCSSHPPAPTPPEVGNAPQPPLTGLPPLRFPPNVGGDPRPSGG